MFWVIQNHSKQLKIDKIDAKYSKLLKVLKECSNSIKMGWNFQYVTWWIFVEK